HGDAPTHRGAAPAHGEGGADVSRARDAPVRHRGGLAHLPASGVPHAQAGHGDRHRAHHSCASPRRPHRRRGAARAGIQTAPSGGRRRRGGDEDVTPAIGTAAADYLSATLIGGDTVGISSWSASLIAVVGAMSPFRTPVVDTVAQLVGGVGDPRVQMQATRLIGQFANITGAEPMLLPTPGVLGTAAARESLMADSTMADVVARWSRLTVARGGIGAMEPADPAPQSGHAFPEADRTALEVAGAVGDICFRFFDDQG